MKANIHGDKVDIIRKDVQIVTTQQDQKLNKEVINWASSIKQNKNGNDFGCPNYNQGKRKLN